MGQTIMALNPSNSSNLEQLALKGLKLTIGYGGHINNFET